MKEGKLRGQSSSHWFTPQKPTTVRARSSQNQEQELHPVLLLGWQDTFQSSLFTFQVFEQEAESEIDAVIAREDLNCCIVFLFFLDF